VSIKLTKALRDHHTGVLIAPHKITVAAWLDVWLRDYKRPSVQPTT